MNGAPVRSSATATRERGLPIHTGTRLLFPEAEPGWYHRESHVAEYQQTLKHLPLELPRGTVLPTEPPASELGTLYQRGAGEVAALFAWLRAIEREALRAHSAGRDLDARHWVKVAAQFTDTDTYAKFNDHSAPISWHVAVIEPALQGDFAPMAADVDQLVH